MSPNSSNSSTLTANMLFKPFWLVAKAAKRIGWVRLLDVSCAIVCKLNPGFWFAREMPKHARGYYSQQDQDKYIEGFFRHHAPETKVFVEVGAFDGVHYSNVRRLFETHGWTGLCVEPVERNFKKLALSYLGSAVKCVNAATSDYEGEAELNVSSYPHLPGWGSDVASLSLNSMGKWDEYKPTWETQRVKVSRLSTILSDACIEAFDVLSIDTEGAELETLRGLDFNEFRPQLVVVEYGDRRREIADLLSSRGYLELRDNGQDLFFMRNSTATRPISYIPGTGDGEALPAATHWEDIRQLINPHLLYLNEINPDNLKSMMMADPRELLRKQRFDLPAKYIYGTLRDLKIDSPWPLELYCEHIRAFNNFFEGDWAGKAGKDNFINSFNGILDSIEDGGLDRDQSIIPVSGDKVLIDGSHRVAACMVYNKPVNCLLVDAPEKNYDYSLFKDRGLGEKYLDAMALECCKLDKNMFIATVFPSAKGDDGIIENALKEIGDIYYKKTVNLRGFGPQYLIMQMYRNEPWLGDFSDAFKGARIKSNACFSKAGPVRVYAFSATTLAAVREVKEKLRGLFGIENHSVHINDNHDETVLLAKMFFNENSIHFMNYARPNYFPTFHKLLAEYETLLNESGVEKEFFCIDGSAVMAAYGIRDARDLDYLHFGQRGLSSDNTLIDPHNDESHHHVTSIDDIIFNPANHYYYNGIKFSSLSTLKSMKLKRNEPKDSRDLLMINLFCASSTLFEILRKFKRLKSRLAQ